MRKYIRLAVAALLTATTLETWAQDADTLSVRRDSVAREESLSEVSVVASSTRTEGDKTMVVITKEMRRGARNTAQMLGNIRGLTWNAMSNSVEYKGRGNIIVLVDSVEKNHGYVMDLHHLRFEKVEIIDQPKGKYEGYDALINLVTKKNYEGYEGNLHANTRLMPAGPNAGKFLYFVNDGSITYTRNKWNFVASASRMSDNRNLLQQWYERTFPVQGLTELQRLQSHSEAQVLDTFFVSNDHEGHIWWVNIDGSCPTRARLVRASSSEQDFDALHQRIRKSLDDVVYYQPWTDDGDDDKRIFIGWTDERQLRHAYIVYYFTSTRQLVIERADGEEPFSICIPHYRYDWFR